MSCRFLLIFLVVSKKKRNFAVTNIKCKNMKENIYDIKWWLVILLYLC